MSADLIIGIVFTFIGGLLVLVALFLFVRTRMFLNTAQEVQGTVTEMVLSRSSKSGISYSPVYEFRTITGQTITIHDTLSTNPPRFQVGQQIDVLYDPENPQNARINKWLNLYFISSLLSFMGFIFGGVGVWLLIVYLF